MRMGQLVGGLFAVILVVPLVFVLAGAFQTSLQKPNARTSHTAGPKAHTPTTLPRPTKRRVDQPTLSLSAQPDASDPASLQPPSQARLALRNGKPRRAPSFAIIATEAPDLARGPAPARRARLPLQAERALRRATLIPPADSF
ncbi:MAG: hypothetical protein AAFR04_03365 [Pseudomonadota bacterium]